MCDDDISFRYLILNNNKWVPRICEIASLFTYEYGQLPAMYGVTLAFFRDGETVRVHGRHQVDPGVVQQPLHVRVSVV